MNNLFQYEMIYSILQADTFNIIKIEEYRTFLISQVKKDQLGSLHGIDLKMFKKGN